MSPRKRLSFAKEALRTLGEVALRNAVGGDYYDDMACTQKQPCVDISSDGNETLQPTRAGKDTCDASCNGTCLTCISWGDTKC